MAVAPSHGPGPFAITKAKIFLVVSLAFTWWLAHIFPHYQPMIRAEFKSRIGEARQKIPSIKVDWHTTEDPRAAFNASKVALLIEPRPIPHLVPQLLHMVTVVPPDWRFLFIGTAKSVASVGRAVAIKHQQVIGKLDLMIMPEPWEIESKESVYRMLTDMRFYNEFLPDVEWILKYEHDSILCANSESSLNDWLDWSWAGAPRSPDDRFSGNGGLSLRRVSAIRRVLEFQARYNDTEAEDEWFGKRLWVLPGEKVAAGKNGVLAVEDVYIEQPMGYHVRDGGRGLRDEVWKNHNQRKKIFEYCPELSLIMDMKLERERCHGDDREGSVHPTEQELQLERAKAAAEEAKKKLAEEEAKKKAEEEARKKEEEKKKQQEQEEARKKEEEEKKKAEEQKKAEEEKKKADEEKKKADEEEKQAAQDEAKKILADEAANGQSQDSTPPATEPPAADPNNSQPAGSTDPPSSTEEYADGLGREEVHDQQS
ncbi:hypothetical protein NKR23_g11638 [Pleurostoma richardsiae]|uniref:DUF5672 domain-containing protein n=1 Tax=Pleurostoma richardsiae TaxID=41990 RepID=A0AA38R9T1_9PEZI|nr:hypothetical protein NKR23_g11638 [Pleurostoma richardsiae]